jgi:hypothetical protein
MFGDHILTKSDITNGVVYSDGCFPVIRSIDLHEPDPLYNIDQDGDGHLDFEGDEFIAKDYHTSYSGPYWIPYRCLYSRNIDNLFMAGRDASFTHEALGAPRVMRTGGLMGEIVGMAASLCKQYSTTPRGVYTTYLDDLKTLMDTPTPPPGDGYVNVALNKPVNVDSIYNSSYPGPNAVDGNYTSNASRWLSANTAFPHWIEVDLQADYEISKMQFWTGYDGYGNAPSNFQFQYWNGSSWVNIFSETGNADATYSREFAPITVNKVRLYMTAGPSQIIRLYEIMVKVLGDETPPAAPTSLVATAGDSSVDLDWADNSESDLADYNVYRSTTQGTGRGLRHAGCWPMTESM